MEIHRVAACGLGICQPDLKAVSLLTITLSEREQEMEMTVTTNPPQGWQCPSCGKAHGPHVDTCPSPVGMSGVQQFRWYPLGAPYAVPGSADPYRYEWVYSTCEAHS